MKPARMALLLTSCVILAACGVRYRDPEPGTEFFTAIDVSGEMRVGAPLTVLVDYEQFYPVDVAFHCELRRNKQIIKRIGDEVVMPLDDGGPDRTPFPGVRAMDFTVDEAGTFIVECLTERDEDNYIAEEIDIAPAVTPEP